MGAAVSSGTRLASRATVGGEEVYRTGVWSVRRHADPDFGLIYVNVETGRVELQPPPEVLSALGLDENGGDSVGEGEPEPCGTDAEDEHGGGSRGAGTASAASGSEAEAQAPSSPRFRRIVLGASCEVPLRMARDILAALREDMSLFTEVQRRFSDAPQEPALGLGEGGLPEELESVALALRPGEVSDVVGTEAGVIQILLRVA